MIRVSKLHLEKVGPFKGQTFTFEHQAGEPDIHILTGINGCGKTTVLHAIAAIFDTFPLNNSGEYLNNQFTRRMDLELSARDGDNPSFVLAAMCDRVDSQYEEIVEIGRIAKGKVISKHRPHRQTSATVPGFEVLDSKAQDELLPEAFRSRISKYCLPHASNYPIREFAAFAYSPNHLVTRTQVNIGSEHEFDPLEDALIFDKSPNSKAAFSTWVAAAEARAGYEIGRGNLDLAKRHRDSVIRLKKALNQLMDETFDESKYEEIKAVFDFDIDTNPWGLAAQINGKKVEFDVMADGLRSILGWLGDLLMRLDRIKWENQEIPVNEQHFLLLLDEIEVHLHPRWQHQLLPMIHELFPNAQIFLTTHSPFIINSIDGAKVYQLVSERGEARLHNVAKSETGYSYQYVFRTMLGVFNQFGVDTVRDLAEFEGLDKEISWNCGSNRASYRGKMMEIESTLDRLDSIDFSTREEALYFLLDHIRLNAVPPGKLDVVWKAFWKRMTIESDPVLLEEVLGGLNHLYYLSPPAKPLNANDLQLMLPAMDVASLHQALPLLVSMEGADAVDVLKSYLKHGHPTVRELAMELLEGIVSS